MFLLTYDGRKGYNQRIGKGLWKSREVWCPRGSRDGCAEEVTIRLGSARGSVFDSREKKGRADGIHKRTAIRRRETLSFKAAEGG